MNSDFKWFMIMVMTLIGFLFCGIALGEYQKSTCKIEAIRAGITVDAALALCEPNAKKLVVSK